MSHEQATLLSRSLILRALNDKQFFQRVPEFRQLVPKLKTMKVTTTRRGCKGCKSRRVEQNVFRDFLHVAQRLDADGIRRLKSYLGAGKLLVTLRNKDTGAFEAQTL